MLLLYALCLIMALWYSIYVREIEVSVSIRVFRNFIFFISLFIFVQLSIDELKKVVVAIVYASSVASLLYCLQPILKTGLLNRVISDLDMIGANEFVTRYYNVPVFICPVIFFLFYAKPVFNIRFRRVQLGINVTAILLTQHRNVLIAVLLCFFIFLILSKKIKFRNAIIYCVLLPFIWITADNLLNNRLSKGFEDVEHASLTNPAVQVQDIALSDLSTTEFRQLMFKERLSFILKDPVRSWLGIGLMTDDSKKAKSLRFYIGIPDDDGNISQIANVDIAWATLILQLGLLGTSLFICLHLSFLKKFFKQRRNCYMQVGLLYIISLLISSLYGSMIVMPYTTCMIMLLVAFYIKESKHPADAANHGKHQYFGNYLAV